METQRVRIRIMPIFTLPIKHLGYPHPPPPPPLPTFILLFRLKNKENVQRQMRRPFSYAANESTQSHYIIYWNHPGGYWAWQKFVLVYVHVLARYFQHKYIILYLSQKGENFYYSFKIFRQFWLAKSTRIIHQNQLRMTKFGRILCLTRKWRQKFRVLAG